MEFHATFIVNMQTKFLFAQFFTTHCLNFSLLSLQFPPCRIEMEVFRTLFLGFLLLLCFGFSFVNGGILKSGEFYAIYNFGDSNSATGGFGAAWAPKPPNANNRICDGHLIIDFIGKNKYTISTFLISCLFENESRPNLISSFNLCS